MNTSINKLKLEALLHCYIRYHLQPKELSKWDY